MAKGFVLVADPMSTTEYRKVRVLSQAYTIGDAVQADWTSDALDVAVATSSSKTTNIYGVAMETVTSAATELLVAIINDKQRWEADTASATVVNSNMLRMVLTDKATVNNTSGADDTSVNAVFQQFGVVGALADKRIVGRFLTAAVAV
jgi:hypothetical protein